MHNRAVGGELLTEETIESGHTELMLRPLLDLLLPAECGGCGLPGAALCPDCQGLLRAPARVYPPCCDPALPVYALGTYQGPLRTALLTYKERSRRDLSTPLGHALARALLRLCAQAGEIWLVPVPSRAAAARQRGGQHVELIARAAAASLAGGGVVAAVAPGLRMGWGVRDSVGLAAADRQLNLAGKVRSRPAGLPPTGTAVVLVDDVVTTGATVAACTAALLRTGVTVSAIVVLAAAGHHTPL